MKGKVLTCIVLLLLFMRADSFFPYDYDSRYSLKKNEVRIEIGSQEEFDPIGESS